MQIQRNRNQSQSIQNHVTFWDFETDFLYDFRNRFSLRLDSMPRHRIRSAGELKPADSASLYYININKYYYTNINIIILLLIFMPKLILILISAEIYFHSNRNLRGTNKIFIYRQNCDLSNNLPPFIPIIFLSITKQKQNKSNFVSGLIKSIAIS